MKLFRLLFILIAFSCSKKQDKILPTERTLTESVYSSVTVQPDSLYKVYTSVAGILDKYFVEEGDLVFNNEAVFEIISTAPKLNAENAKFTLDLAKENYNGSAAILKSIKKEIAAATLKCKNDSINFIRQKNLWDQKIGSKIEYDNKKLNYQLSQNNLQILKSKYKQNQNQLQISVKQAQNNYQALLINTKDFIIKSKISGKVYAIYKEPGEIVTITEPLAAIGSATNFIIEMLVDEADIIHISLNQNVLINLDAYNNQIFKGQVSKIYPKKDERNQTFKVEALFESYPKILYPGLSGEANIIIRKKDKVLTIPKEYLIGQNKVLTNDGLSTIHTGLQNMEYVEVLSGITKDTFIYKP